MKGIIQVKILIKGIVQVKKLIKGIVQVDCSDKNINNERDYSGKNIN